MQWSIIFRLSKINIPSRTRNIILRLPKRLFTFRIGKYDEWSEFWTGSLGAGSYRNDRFNNSVGVSADVLVYNNGRLEKNVRKLQFDVEASQYDIEAIKNDISVQIAQQYLTALLNKEIVKFPKVL
jgi:hypothetical protein